MLRESLELREYDAPDAADALDADGPLADRRKGTRRESLRGFDADDLDVRLAESRHGRLRRAKDLLEWKELERSLVDYSEGVLE